MTELSLSHRLAGAESRIEKTKDAAHEFWKALAEVRSEKLWMAGGKYASFDDYCKKRWNWGKAYANRIASAGEVARQIEKSPIGDSPKNEAQARPLAKLPESEQGEAWQEAVEESKSEGKPVTAAKVQEVVTRRMQPEEADEWVEVESEPEEHAPESQQSEDKEKPKVKNGQPTVTMRERKKAYAAWGGVVRHMHKAGVKQENEKAIQQIEGALRV